MFQENRLADGVAAFLRGFIVNGFIPCLILLYVLPLFLIYLSTMTKRESERGIGRTQDTFFVCLRQSPAFLREEEVYYFNLYSFSILFIGRSIDRRGMPTVLDFLPTRPV